MYVYHMINLHVSKVQFINNYLYPVNRDIDIIGNLIKSIINTIVITITVFVYQSFKLH